MIRCFRLSSWQYPVNTGTGAALFGGRWNPVGTPVIYASANPSLAVLEVLVHFSRLPRGFVLTEIEVPTEVEIEAVDAAQLPADWDSLAPTSATQRFGSSWVNEARSAVLAVPSSIVPMDRNLIINPGHADFRKIRFLQPIPFRFDPRLKTESSNG